MFTTLDICKYLLLDCYLLADIFDSWRDISLRHYGLDPASFLTAPALSWAAGLKMTKAYLDLLTDIEMVNFIDKGKGFI